jgi:hypothetical protein
VVSSSQRPTRQILYLQIYGYDGDHGKQGILPALAVRRGQDSI